MDRNLSHDSAASEEPVDADATPDLATKQNPRSPWGRLGKRTLVTVVVLLALSQCCVFAYYTLPDSSTANDPGSEICLGEFRFLPKRPEEGPIAHARFTLYVVLEDQAAPTARQRLLAHRFRLRQDIEELVRQAHAADFEDPVLAELKRQFKERIEATLGMRAIAEVIIVDLNLETALKSPH
jgi:hypothetical protein